MLNLDHESWLKHYFHHYMSYLEICCLSGSGLCLCAGGLFGGFSSTQSVFFLFSSVYKNWFCGHSRDFLPTFMTIFTALKYLDEMLLFLTLSSLPVSECDHMTTNHSRAKKRRWRKVCLSEKSGVCTDNYCLMKLEQPIELREEKQTKALILSSQ